MSEDRWNFSEDDKEKIKNGGWVSGSYKDILFMIENVDPADSERLDEIDALVWCYINKQEFCHMGWHKNKGYKASGIGGFVYEHPCSDPREVTLKDGTKAVVITTVWREITKYTRSRDALKSIRPDLSEFQINTMVTGGWCCHWQFKEMRLSECAVGLPTEELAELHAIIQAIEWERGNA